jgi:hypothetical protein
MRGDTSNVIVVLVNGINAEVGNPVSDWQTNMTGYLKEAGFKDIWTTSAAYNTQTASGLIIEHLGDLWQVCDEYEQGPNGIWTINASRSIHDQTKKAYGEHLPGEVRFVLVGYSGGAPIVANLAKEIERDHGSSAVKGVVLVGPVNGNIASAAQAADKVAIISRAHDEASALRGALTTNPETLEIWDGRRSRHLAYIASQPDVYGECEAIPNCSVVTIPDYAWPYPKGIFLQHNTYDLDSTTAEEIYRIFGPGR